MDFIHPLDEKTIGNYLIETDIELFYEISNPIINILIPLFSESNESFYVFDGIISGVDIKTHVADGIQPPLQHQGNIIWCIGQC